MTTTTADIWKKITQDDGENTASPVFLVRNCRGYNLMAQVEVKRPEDQRVVIVTHGFNADRNSPTPLFLSKNIGFNTVRFDFRGNGGSEGFADWRFGDYVEEADEDLRAVVEHLRKMGGEVIGVVGHSRSGTTVLMYASRFDDVPCVISCAGRLKMEEGVWKHLKKENFAPGGPEEDYIVGADKRKRRVTREDVDKRCAIRPMKILRRRKDYAVSKFLFVHGTADTVTPVDASITLHAFCKENDIPSELCLVEGAGHRLVTELHHATVLARAISVFIQNRMEDFQLITPEYIQNHQD